MVLSELMQDLKGQEALGNQVAGEAADTITLLLGDLQIQREKVSMMETVAHILEQQLINETAGR